jgi:hypothetical protein
MLHFRSLDVYRCAIALVPKAYAIAENLDREIASQLRRSAMMIALCIAGESLAGARESALQTAAVLDIVRVLEMHATEIDDVDALLTRILAAL